MEIRGKVLAVLEPTFGIGKSSDVKIQTIIVEYVNGDRKQRLALTNKRYPDEFAKIPVGATGTFRINPYSREFSGRWYTETICYNWSIDRHPQDLTEQDGNWI